LAETFLFPRKGSQQRARRRAVAGFVVDASSLDGGAGEFKKEGVAALEAGQHFHSAAALPDEVFGNLPESAMVAKKYQELHSNITNDMAKLSTALLDGTAKLAMSAFLYRLADELAAERAKGVVP
jgi:hypothetical protein